MEAWPSIFGLLIVEKLFITGVVAHEYVIKYPDSDGGAGVDDPMSLHGDRSGCELSLEPT